jgi:hypothetical protein
MEDFIMNRGDDDLFEKGELIPTLGEAVVMALVGFLIFAAYYYL